MSLKAKMDYSSGLEHIVGNTYLGNYSRVNHFSRNIDDNYTFIDKNSAVFETQYPKTSSFQYHKKQQYIVEYSSSHSFAPEFFLSLSRQRMIFVDDNDKASGMCLQKHCQTSMTRKPRHLPL